jgi:biopolymer transport protein ExbD
METSNSAYKADEATPSINVTPLIDILLVLLVIFMVISPLKPARFETKVPAEPKDEEKNQNIKPNPLTLVISIGTDLKIKLNKDEMGDNSNTDPLTDNLKKIFKDRENNLVYKDGTNEIEKTVFVKAPKIVKYGEVVKLIDAIKLAGATPVGLQIDDLQ